LTKQHFKTKFKILAHFSKEDMSALSVLKNYQYHFCASDKVDIWDMGGKSSAC
jgi:hypothetical protein